MRSILGSEAKNFDPASKWALLSPLIRQHGREALSYATLQQGMEYFVHELGYLAFTTATHPVFAPKSKRIVLADPVCAEADLPALLKAFLKEYPSAVFPVVSELCARTLRPMGFKANCIGYEPELPVQTYNTLGNWKEFDMIKRARNESKREGVEIREVAIESVPVEELNALSAKWIEGKTVNDREIWVYARRPVYQPEPDVRKFVAFNREGAAVGYVFYDPMYRDGKIYGYAANTVRCDEARYGRLATAIHMAAIEAFRPDGVEVLNLCLCPFSRIETGIFADSFITRWYFILSERFGGEIYNFKGLSFHKSKYRGSEKALYFASNGLMPWNDVYLAFLTSDISDGYFSTMARFGLGVFKELTKPKVKPKAGKAK
ncbi:MAG: phosphatidylglycerol lysyltransferase domain-containing protein [Prosthecobacter sp.]|nr:phosphatidylglycerol lysyltransferase domain-containing protein [Prosthecobacter sp.]